MNVRGFLKSDSAFAGCLVLVFFCVVLATMLQHEMWRDEYQHWMIARDSSSLAELAKNAGHERHPGLWYLCLYALSRLTDRAVIMQGFHLVLATAAVFVLAHYSRFARWQKVLLAFGYFIVYEYAVISRHYVLGVLSVFLLCAVFESRRKSYLPVACVLFLVAQSSVSALVIGLTLAFAMVCEAIGDASIRRSLSTRKLEIAASLCVVLVGAAISVYQIVTPLESGEGFAGGAGAGRAGWLTPIHMTRIKTALAAVWQSYVPIPEMHGEFWNTNIVTSLDARAILSLVLLAFGVVLFARKRLALAVYSLGSLALVAYFYVIYFVKRGGYLRHHGYLFILFVACAWIAAYERDREGERRTLRGAARILSGCGKGFFILILCLQVVAGVIASARDWSGPFSASKAVAAFIRERGMEDLVMVGDVDWAGSCIAGRLNRPIYYATTKREGTFVVWTSQRRKWNRLPEHVKAQRLAEWASELAEQSRKDVLLILNYPINTSESSLVEIGTFLDSALGSETYYLYLMKYQPPDAGT